MLASSVIFVSSVVIIFDFCRNGEAGQLGGWFFALHFGELLLNKTIGLIALGTWLKAMPIGVYAFIDKKGSRSLLQANVNKIIFGMRIWMSVGDWEF